MTPPRASIVTVVSTIQINLWLIHIRVSAVIAASLGICSVRPSIILLADIATGYYRVIIANGNRPGTGRRVKKLYEMQDGLTGLCAKM